MTLAVTPIYAAILALLLIGLSARVVQRRMAAGVSVGDGGDEDLIKRIRVQANCAEYAPLGLLLLLVNELAGASALIVHGLGIILVTGRVCHARGLGSSPQVLILRKVGMLLTFSMLACEGSSLRRNRPT